MEVVIKSNEDPRQQRLRKLQLDAQEAIPNTGAILDRRMEALRSGVGPEELHLKVNWTETARIYDLLEGPPAFKHETSRIKPQNVKEKVKAMGSAMIFGMPIIIEPAPDEPELYRSR